MLSKKVKYLFGKSANFLNTNFICDLFSLAALAYSVFCLGFFYLIISINILRFFSSSILRQVDIVLNSNFLFIQICYYQKVLAMSNRFNQRPERTKFKGNDNALGIGWKV
jgi:hypothetical protein